MTSTERIATAAPDARDGSHDFDFLHGRWRVHHRRLRRPLSGSAEWYEFDGTCIERPLWGGRANIEEVHATLPDGTPLRGLALRLYVPARRCWTIHWSNGATGTLDAPMIGAFLNGIGVFHGEDEYERRTVLLRFHWRSLGPDAARWEQAFSDDDGRTWETNWIMDFTRTGDASSVRDEEAPHA